LEARVKQIRLVLILLVAAQENTMFPHPLEPVPFSTVPAPRLWEIDGQARYIVVTGKNWAQYYSSPPQDADFDTSVYVVASMGTRPNPGYRIRIERILQDGERVQVAVAELNPDPTGIYPQVLVNPVAVAEVKIKDLEPHPLLIFTFVSRSGRRLADFTVEL
jgi:hypothetical protein